ncbi:hypothetical protein ACFQ1L_32070 [Phytohabitans flavus]|uniref:hypothetical protein n=1 Tax=Phytohabitans flavus TaxID=1076124 RepID=UPI00362AD031
MGDDDLDLFHAGHYRGSIGDAASGLSRTIRNLDLHPVPADMAGGALASVTFTSDPAATAGRVPWPAWPAVGKAMWVGLALFQQHGLRQRGTHAHLPRALT